MKEQQLRKNSDAGSWEIIPSLPAYFILHQGHIVTSCGQLTSTR